MCQPLLSYIEKIEEILILKPGTINSIRLSAVSTLGKKRKSKTNAHLILDKLRTTQKLPR